MIDTGKTQGTSLCSYLLYKRVLLKETDLETLWTESKPSKPYKIFYLLKDS